MGSLQSELEKIKQVSPELNGYISFTTKSADICFPVKMAGDDLVGTLAHMIEVSSDGWVHLGLGAGRSRVTRIGLDYYARVSCQLPDNMQNGFFAIERIIPMNGEKGGFNFKIVRIRDRIERHRKPAPPVTGQPASLEEVKHAVATVNGYVACNSMAEVVVENNRLSIRLVIS